MIIPHVPHHQQVVMFGDIPGPGYLVYCALKHVDLQLAVTIGLLPRLPLASFRGNVSLTRDLPLQLYYAIVYRASHPCMFIPLA